MKMSRYGAGALLCFVRRVPCRRARPRRQADDRGPCQRHRYLGRSASARSGQQEPGGRHRPAGGHDGNHGHLLFNKAAKAYHDHYPGEQQDALRLDVRPEEGPHVETLSFSFPVVEGKDAVLRLEWGTIRVPLSIRVP